MTFFSPMPDDESTAEHRARRMEQMQEWRAEEDSREHAHALRLEDPAGVLVRVDKYLTERTSLAYLVYRRLLMRDNPALMLMRDNPALIIKPDNQELVAFNVWQSVGDARELIRRACARWKEGGSL